MPDTTNAQTAGPAVAPPKITPPNVPPSATKDLGANYSLAAGHSLYFDVARGLVCTTALTVTNAGTIAVIRDGYAKGIGNDLEDVSPFGFVNEAGGLLEVEAKTGVAYGYQSQTNIANISNAGTIEAVALDGDAEGIEGYGGYGVSDVDNAKTGVIDVWASELGVGVDFYQLGASLTNAGSIIVNAGTAIGVIDTAPFGNSGTIMATSTVKGAASIGVEITAGAVQLAGAATFANSGLIEATEAVYLYAQSQDPPLWTDITLNNSGTIEGAIDLSTGDDTLINTGTITGSIVFGRGNVDFDGSAGISLGPIYLGDSDNDVGMGKTGGTVFANPVGGNDTITAGAGRDFIEIFRGDNTVAGGSGVVTVSFAGADAGVTVDLATGIATGVGTDSLSHVHTVIGSLNHDNTLIAGSAIAELIAGNAQDTLIGGKNNDILVAGEGGDLMTGGGGANTFVFQAGDHTLTVTDFDQGGSTDSLHIYGYGAAESVQQVGANTVITLSATDQIVLENTQASSLVAGTSYVFEAGVFATPTPTGVAPAMSTSGLTLFNDFQVYAGETLRTGPGGIYDSGLMTSAYFYFHNFTNAGRVVVSGKSASGGLVGFYCGQYAGHSGEFDNLAGASFSVSSSADATGYEAPDWGPNIVNAGTITIAGATGAVGVDSWDPDETLDNSGMWIVSASDGQAEGFILDNGAAALINTGSLVVSGSLSAIGVDLGYAGEPNAFDNQGHIVVTATSGAATGVYVDALSGATLTNSGTISARIAFDAAGASSAITIVNSGLVIGALELSGSSHSTLDNTGIWKANSGASTLSTLVNGGVVQISGDASVAITAAASGAGVLEINHGTADIAGAFGGKVEYLAANSTLELADSQAFTGTISDFSKTGVNELDLADIAFAKAKVSFSGTSASGVLTVTDGTHTARIDLIGDYLGSVFTLWADANGGTEVTDPSATPTAAPSSEVSAQMLTTAMAAMTTPTPGVVPVAMQHAPERLLFAAR